MGEGIHEFLNFDIRFNKDLTFLTGINGSGKTSVLNATISLITPSLSMLAELDYTSIRIDLEHDGKNGFVQATKDSNNISISCSDVDSEFVYQKFVMLSEAPQYREREIQQEYYSELASNARMHPVMDFIAGLPTPMFLGIDRRPRFLADETSPARRTSPRVQGRVGRNIFSASLTQSLAEAAGLVETHYRDSLIEVGLVGEALQGSMLLELLAVEPKESFLLSSPSRADIEKIKAMRRDVEALPDILRLPPSEVRNRILPFLDALEEYAKQIPHNLTTNQLVARHKPSDSVFQAMLYWSTNNRELSRIKIVSDLVEGYYEKRKEITGPNERYLALINSFLTDSGKMLRVNEKGYPWISIEGVEGDKPLSSLSSGEAQIFVILTYLAFHPLAQSANVFIIDEPELSLHVQWQELFVDSVMSANPQTQYILATHSPSIILERQNKCFDISKRQKGGRQTRA